MNYRSAFNKATDKFNRSVDRFANAFNKASGIDKLHAKGLEYNDAEVITSIATPMASGIAAMSFTAALGFPAIPLIGAAAIACAVTGIGAGVITGIGTAVLLNRLICARKKRKQAKTQKSVQTQKLPTP
jgi:hypothetical protein